MNEGSKAGDIYVSNPRKRVYAIILITLPFLACFLAIGGYLILQFFVGQKGDNSVMNAGLVGLGLLGLLGAVGLFILMPIGVIMLFGSRGELKAGLPYDERSGRGNASVVPAEIKGWNWGAAFLSFWWGLYYQVWIMFVIFVPVLGGIWWIVMGIKGNEWAWRSNKWQSVEQFKQSQKKWLPWAIVSLIVSAFFLISFVFSIFSLEQSAVGMFKGGGANLAPGIFPNFSGLSNTFLNANLPSLGSGKAGKVVGAAADGKTFDLSATDGKRYSVDMENASFFGVGGVSGKRATVGDNVVVTGTETNGIIKASGVLDYGPVNNAPY